MGRFILKAVLALIVFGAVFMAGWMAGGASSITVAQSALEQQAAQCLPITTADALHACLEAQQ